MVKSGLTVIGENIHTTRVLRTNGKRVIRNENGDEFVVYKNIDDITSLMPIPDFFKDTQIYKQGSVKHFMIAVTLGMSDLTEDRIHGENYISAEIKRQEDKGSNFLDLNVDEISYKIDIQKKAMAWLIGH